MIWCIISMISGAALFAAGIVFRQMLNNEHEPIPESENVEMDTAIFEQWKKLLEYDGNEQEAEYENR